MTDEASARAAIEQIVVEQGRIDVLVNNAGYGSYGALEDVPLSEAQAQLDVNVLGLARLSQLVLPHMRAQKSGTIVNVSSMGGKLTTALGSWYHASKYAVEAISDAMRMELEPFGIHVVVIEPGAIRTEWGAITAKTVLATSGGGVYRSQAKAVAAYLSGSSNSQTTRASSPDVVARAITKSVTIARPRTRYRVGFAAKPVVFIRRFLPDRTFDALIKRGFGVTG